MTPAASETSAFQAAFDAIRDRTGDRYAAEREHAFETFLRMGLPTTREEDWRQTSVAAIGKIKFHVGPLSALASAPVRDFLLGRHEGPRLVLVNGRFVPELSRTGSLGEGVRVESLAAALRGRDDAARRALFGLVPTDAAAFPALNAALFEDGAFVQVPRGVALAQPVHVLHVTDGAGDTVLANPRLLVRIEEGAQATIVETHAGRTGETFTNVVVEADVGDGAVLAHANAQLQAPGAYHVATTNVRVGRSAAYRSTVASLGARLSRHDLRVTLAGEGASCELYGLSLLGGSQHADHHTFVDHAVPHGSSRQAYDGAYAGSSRGVFAGAVLVRHDAQKTEAHQENHNLILSDGALVDSKPQLEIFADDVRCTHGATIGRLAEDPLFYLRSRGLSLDQARRILIRGFLQAQVDRVRPDALRADLEARVAAKLEEIEA